MIDCMLLATIVLQATLTRSCTYVLKLLHVICSPKQHCQHGAIGMFPQTLHGNVFVLLYVFSYVMFIKVLLHQMCCVL